MPEFVCVSVCVYLMFIYIVSVHMNTTLVYISWCVLWRIWINCKLIFFSFAFLGETHHAAVWAGHVWEKPRLTVQLLELVFWRPNEHCWKEGQGQGRIQSQISGLRNHVKWHTKDVVLRGHTENVDWSTILFKLFLIIVCAWVVCSGVDCRPLPEARTHWERPLCERTEAK